MGKVITPLEVNQYYRKLDEIPSFVDELSLYEKQEVLKYARESLHQDLKLIYDLMEKNPGKDIEYWKQRLDSYQRNEKVIAILTENKLEDPESKSFKKVPENFGPKKGLHPSGNGVIFQKFEIQEIEDLINISTLEFTNNEIVKIGDSLIQNREKFMEFTTGAELEDFNQRHKENYKEGEVKHMIKPKTPAEAFVQLKEGVAESFAMLLKLKFERIYDKSSLLEVIKEEVALIEWFINEADKVSVIDAYKIKKNKSSFDPNDFFYEYNDPMHELKRIKVGFYNKYFCDFESMYSLPSKVWALCFIYLPFIKQFLIEEVGNNPNQEVTIGSEKEAVEKEFKSSQIPENKFCKGMPISVPLEHFKVFTETESKTGNPFLTQEAFDSFIQRAFYGKNEPRQTFSLGSREKGFVIMRFYQFYSICWPDFESTQQCRDKYIQLLSDNFIGWDFQDIKSNFSKKVKNREW